MKGQGLKNFAADSHIQKRIKVIMNSKNKNITLQSNMPTSIIK